MLYKERLLPIQEFSGVEITNPFEEDLVTRLQEPTHDVAHLYQMVVDPLVWYTGVYSGSFGDPKKLDTFKREYNRRAEEDPILKDPYTYIDSNWTPRSIASLPEVNKRLRKMSKSLVLTAKSIRKGPLVNSYADFADYLEVTAEALPEGHFNESMVKFLRLPTSNRVRWMGLPVEYQDDPLGIKYAPQSFISYTDKEQTIAANLLIARYEKVGREKFGVAPTSANTFVSYMIACSGFLGVGDRRISAFNIPNNSEVSDSAGNVVIDLFPDRIAKKNEKVLSPALERLSGVQSSSEDVEEFALAHEEGHGWRFKGEDQRLGPVRSHIREGLANRRAVLMAATQYFPTEHTRRVVLGHLAYGADDLGEKFRAIIFEPLGRNQPTVEELVMGGSYTPDAYFLWRQAFLRGAVSRATGSINEEGIVRLAEEIEPIYAEIASSGTEESARQRLAELIDTRTVFSVTQALKDVLDKARRASALLS